MSRLTPSGNLSDKWTDYDDLLQTPPPKNTGNVLWLADDHNFTFLSTGCGTTQYLYCGDTSWSTMDDIRLRFSCDETNCGDLAGQTTFSINGMESHCDSATCLP
jgi:hypothetical protein